MPRIRVYPYKAGSRSAAALAAALGGRVLRREGSRFVQRPGDTVINWGASVVPPGLRVVNSSAAVATASCKLASFTALQAAAVPIPRFWTARADIPDDAFPVVCRRVLRGHSGAGIVVADTRADLVDAPLYTAYVKKRDEYRIHVGIRDGGASIISVQRKARRDGVEIADQRIRNHANGFVFVRGGVNPPPCVLEAAIASVRALGLDFGAVDLGFNERSGLATVYEVNTACGLEGQTVADYRDFFNDNR